MEALAGYKQRKLVLCSFQCLRNLLTALWALGFNLDTTSAWIYLLWASKEQNLCTRALFSLHQGGNFFLWLFLFLSSLCGQASFLLPFSLCFCFCLSLVKLLLCNLLGLKTVTFQFQTLEHGGYRPVLPHLHVALRIHFVKTIWPSAHQHVHLRAWTLVCSKKANSLWQRMLCDLYIWKLCWYLIQHDKQNIVHLISQQQYLRRNTAVSLLF